MRTLQSFEPEPFVIAVHFNKPGVGVEEPLLKDDVQILLSVWGWQKKKFHA